MVPRGLHMEPLTALDWQEIFLAGARAAASPGPDALALALAAMAGKAREIAERQRAAHT